MIAALLLFWVPVGILVWVYLGYPLVAAVAARIRPFRVRRAGRRPWSASTSPPT
jgi:hypothetical protein